MIFLGFIYCIESRIDDRFILASIWYLRLVVFVIYQQYIKHQECTVVVFCVLRYVNSIANVTVVDARLFTVNSVFALYIYEGIW